MEKRINWVIYRAPYAAAILFAITSLVCLIAYMLAGTFSTDKLPRIFDSRRELIGMVAMLIILPSYLVASFVISQRRTVTLFTEIKDSSLQRYTAAAQHLPKRYLVSGLLSGLSFSIFNMPAGFTEIINGGPIIILIALSQILLWLLVGALLSARFYSARLFYRAGKQISLDIFETTNLKVFPLSGLSDTLLILLGLTLTILQAIDAQFRFENYIGGIVVCLPAILVLMITPMYSLHRRIVETKKRELLKLNRLIVEASKDLVPESIQTLELLLQRRRRLKDVSNWPIDLSVVSRLLLYIVIPPIAWLGAAFVEIGLDGFLGGS